jgi:two-component system cell cycle response regulator
MERRGRGSERALILIIEDDAGVRDSLSDLLVAKFEVLTASDAGAGVELAREHHPDLILLDRFLPSGDGLSVLRTRPPWRSVWSAGRWTSSTSRRAPGS